MFGKNRLFKMIGIIILFGLSFTRPVMTQEDPGVELSVMTWNIHEWDFPHNENPNIPNIVAFIQYYNPDLVGLQEAFIGRVLAAFAWDYRYWISGRLTNNFTQHLGSGLSALCRYQLRDQDHIEWKDCFGSFGCDGSDCDADKGFFYVQIKIPYSYTGGFVNIDFYNLHADAGDSSSDSSIRLRQFQQLTNYIKEHSDLPSKRPLIVLGDFNLLKDHGGDQNTLNQFLNAHGLSKTVLTDDHTAIAYGGQQKFDYILYRSSEDLQLEELLDGGEVLYNSYPYSDHHPIFTKFRIKRNPRMKLQLTTPNGGQILQEGDRVTIAWNVSPDESYGNVVIDLLENDHHYRNIIDGSAQIPVTAGSYTWTVGETSGATMRSGQYYKFMISSDLYPSINDVSEGPIRIDINDSGSVGFEINYPISSSRIRKGNNIEILYTLPEYNDPEKEDYPDGTMKVVLHGPTSGIIRNMITVDDIHPRLGYRCWSWSVTSLLDGTPIQPGSNYQLQLIFNKKPWVFFYSQSFTIIDRINITVPRQDEIVRLNHSFPVTWDPLVVNGNLRMKLYHNGQPYKSGIVYEFLTNDGIKHWAVGTLLDTEPLVPAPGYQIYLESKKSPDIWGISSPFTIKRGEFIQVLHPNSGGTMTRGGEITISWTGVNIPGKVNLILCNGSANIGRIAENLPATGTYVWRVGDPLVNPAGATYPDGSQFKIMVKSIDDDTINDTSDFSFTIADPNPPLIRVDEPNGGETFDLNDTVTLRWYSENIHDTVVIGLLQNNTSLGYIAQAVPNTGSYEWTIDQLDHGAPILAGSGYQIQIKTTTTGIAGDLSDASFIINGPHQLPGVPALITPVNGTSTHDPTPTFSWKLVSANPAVDNYVLYISNAATGSSVYSFECGNVSSFTPTSSYPLASGKTYHWKVKAENSLGFGPYSDPFTITITGSAPVSSPNATYPKNGREVSDTTPTFFWNSVSANPSVTNYKIQLRGTDNSYDFSRTKGNITSYTLPSRHALSVGKSYKWRVKAINAVGDGPYCGWKYFKIVK